MKIGRKAVFIGSSIALVIIGAVTYEVILPNHYASVYNKQMQKSTATLHENLGKVADSAVRPVFTNPDSTTESDVNDLKVIKDAEAGADTSLADFTAKNNSLKKLPLSGYFGSYKKAKNEQTQAKATAADISKRLANYKVLIAFMDGVNILGQKEGNQGEALGQVASATSVDDYLKIVNTATTAYHNDAIEIRSLTAPADFSDFKQQLADLIDQMANNLSSFATAVKNSDVSTIMSANAKISDLTDKGDSLTKSAYEKLAANSPLIKPVRELSTITDQLSF